MSRVARVVAALAVLAIACDGADRDVVVGSKTFTESVILGEAATQVLRSAGVPAHHRRELGGTRVLWSALLRGDIDVYPEYTGTLVEEVLSGRGGGGTEDLRAALAEQGVVLGPRLGFNNTYAMGMLRSRAEELGIHTISDLREHPDLTLGFSNEFMNREDGWPGLRDRYGLSPDAARGLSHALAYRGLESGALDVTDLYSTDAEITVHDLTVLTDDLGYFPDYDAVILYRADLARTAPRAPAALARLAGAIDAATMTRLNAAARLHGQPEAEVAAGFLQEQLGVEGEVATDTVASRLWTHTLEHLVLVAISLLAAVIAAIPLGVLAARRPGAGRLILGAVGIVQTIPSLALLVFMIPLVGIGGAPAILALFLYSLLPIVQNTHAGLTGIAPGLRESAEALGLPSGARLRLVELPLASPSILAGIKTSAVINVGTATLGALVGAGGYGQPILTGIRLDDVGRILEGAVPAAVLALLVQGLFELVERAVVPRGLRIRR